MLTDNLNAGRYSNRNIQRNKEVSVQSLNLPSASQSTPLFESNANAENDERPYKSDPCSFHNIEKAINIAYGKKITGLKSLKDIQQYVSRVKQPCLFDSAYVFGGSDCSDQCYNGMCTFHWSMLNLKVVLCDNYNSISAKKVKFQHYEFVVENIIEDRSFIPIFPYIDYETTVYDLLFGFMYATTRGLETTKKNEGVAMAYTLYYMINSNCRFEWQLRSAYWIDSMTNYLMSAVAYNDKLLRSGLVHDVSSGARPTFVEKNISYESVLKRFFSKEIVIRNLTVPYEKPLAPKMDGRVVRSDQLSSITPPMQNAGDPTRSNTRDENDVASNSARPDQQQRQQEQDSEWYSEPYYKMSIFVAPLIMSLRSSTYIMDTAEYAAPPVISLVNLKFIDSSPIKVFTLQGPILYGVSDVTNNRGLPFSTDMIKCTQLYVATLGSATNVEPQEDRIFGGMTSNQVRFTVTTDIEKVRMPNQQLAIGIGSNDD